MSWSTPNGTGETWRRLCAKALLSVAGPEAKQACGVDQLCAGLEADVEGAIHHMKNVWELHRKEEELGFLLIDATNAFNELNWTMMLWSVRHLWPSGARFVFNCYRHWSTLVVRGFSGTDSAFLSSQEGMTQGDPLSMIVYGIGTLPQTRQLRAKFPEVEQPWYADDGGASGHFTSILRLFGRLQEVGPQFGYFPCKQ